MTEAILGMLIAWAQAYAAEPFYTGLIGIAAGMAAVVIFSAWFRARTHMRDQISGGPILIVAALAVFGICLLWTLIDALLIWDSKPLLSEHLIVWLAPEPQVVADMRPIDVSLLIRETMGAPDDPSSPLLPGGVSMALGLLFGGLVYYIIASVIGSTLSEMLSLTRKPEDIIRAEKRKRAEEKEKAKAEAEAARAVTDGGASDPPGQTSGDKADSTAQPGATTRSDADQAKSSDVTEDEDEDEEYDHETMGAPLPNDFWGNLYKFGGHFRSYEYVENRFMRWHRVLALTFYGLLALGAIPATGAFMPVPMWVGGAIFATAFWMLVPAKQQRVDKPPAKAENRGEATGATGERAPTARSAFAARAEVSVHLRKAPVPPPKPSGNKTVKVHAARVLDDITSALGMDGLYPHQAAAMAEFDARRSVLLSSAPSSGRQVLADALALYAVLADGERVLYLAESPERAASAHRRFEGRAEATHWKWNILAVNLADRAGKLDPNQSQPALVFADPRAVHQHLCGQPQRWQTFLAGVGTIITPRLTAHNGVRAGHLVHLLTRLHRAIRRARTIALGRDLLTDDTLTSTGADDGHGAALRFLATAHPGHDNLARYVERIIGTAVTVIGPKRDGAPRPRQDARIVSSSFDPGGEHPALGLRDLAKEMGYRPALHGYDGMFTEEQRDSTVTTGDADVIIARHNPGTHGSLTLDTMHLGDRRKKRGGRSPSVAVLWQPDPTPMARLWADRLADELARRARGDSSKAREREPIGHALIVQPGALRIERSHLLCTLAESEIEIDELLRTFSRDCLRSVLGELRASGRLLESQRRLLDAHAGEVKTVHSVRMSTSEDIHASISLATSGPHWTLCERATGDVLGELEGARARAAAYPLRVFTARGRRFEVLADELQDQFSRRRILCQQIDRSVVSAPIRTLFIEVVERRKRRAEVPEADAPTEPGSTPGAVAASEPTEAVADAREPAAETGGDSPDNSADEPKTERRRGGLRSLGGARFSLQLRNVRVTETMAGVRRFDLRGNELDTSLYERAIENALDTQATVFGLPPEHFPGGLVAPLPALHALVHGFTAALPSLVAYRPEEDLDIAPLARAGAWSTPSVVFVDLHPGGAGFAEAITLNVIRRLCRHTLDLMDSCVAACATGCPECIHSSTCRAPGQHYQDTDKAGATLILRALLGESAPPAE